MRKLVKIKFELDLPFIVSLAILLACDHVLKAVSLVKCVGDQANGGVVTSRRLGLVEAGDHVLSLLKD